MSAIFKRIIFVLAIVTTLLFFSLIGAAWYLGAFATVKVSKVENPIKYFITSSGKGTYQNTMNDLNTLKAHIERSSLPAGEPAILLYDDPLLSPLPKVTSRAAFVLPDSITIDPPYRLLVLPPRETIRAVIDANPAIAAYKTYPAIREWYLRYKLNPDTAGIIIEYYQPDGFIVVEYPISSE